MTITATVSDVILDRYARYGWSAQDGEWGYIQSRTRREYRELLDRGDASELDEHFNGMFQSPMCVGLVSVDYRSMGTAHNRGRYMADTEHNVLMWRAHTDSSDVERLAAPVVGQALAVDVDGTSVMIDTPRHDHYAHRLGATLRGGQGTILEIGGGYGGFALQAIRQFGDKMRVVICDLPETLYLAYYWLSRAGVDVGWWDDGSSFDVALVPAADLGYIEDIHALLAAHSLCEMPLAVARRYIDWVDSSRPPYVLLDTAHVLDKCAVLTTADVFPETMSHDLMPGESYREMYRAPTCWAGSGKRYWEFLFGLAA